MTTSYQRLNRIRKADLFTDTLTASQIAGIEASAVDHEDFLGGILSQFKRTIGATDWFSSVEDSAGQPRSLKTITDDIYYKDILRRRHVLPHVAVPAAVAATGSITTVAAASLVDGETFTLDDVVPGHTAKVFEFDIGGGGVNPGNVAVTLVGTEDANAVRDAMISAINGVGAALSITAASGGAGVVGLTHDLTGSYNAAISDTVSAGGFVPTGMSGGAGNTVTLSQASSETPSEVAAVGAGSANGAVVASLAGAVGVLSLAEVAGLNAISPKNLCLVREAGTNDPIMSGGNQVYALLQAASGVVDGDNFNDSTKRVQLSFVKQNPTDDDLVVVPTADIAGKSIDYSYTSRTELRLMNEQDFLMGAFADSTAASALTLQEAYVGGSTVDVMTSEGNLTFNLSDDLTSFRVQRNGGSFATFLRDDTLGDKLTLDLDILDVNNVTDADFLNGAKFDTGATTINVGVTSGRVDATALTVASTAGDLNLNASAAVKFTTVRESAIPLDDATAGAISALPGGPYASIAGAIRAALTSSDVDVFVQEIQSNYAQDANVPGAGNGNAQDWSPALDLSSRSISMLAADVTTLDTILFLNGSLLWGGSAVTNNEVYKGTTPANGDLKYDFAKGVKAGDVVIAVSFKAG